MVTVSAYNAGQRFGVLDIDNDGNVRQFREKIQGDASPINIGYMICEPEFIDLIDGDDTVLEKTPMQKAAAMNEIMAYRHEGFWKCMDTVRENNSLKNYGVKATLRGRHGRTRVEKCNYYRCRRFCRQLHNRIFS